MKVQSAADTASMAAANTIANCTVRRVLRDRNGFTDSCRGSSAETSMSVGRHWHGRRPERDSEALAAIARGYGLRDAVARSAQIGVPHRQPGRLIGRIGKGDDSAAVR